MTRVLHDVLFRPLAEGEFDLFEAYASPPTSGVGTRSLTFAEFVARGDYRPDWVWVALRDDEVIARIAFWAPPDSAHPWTVDWFDPGVGPDRIEVGTALLRASYEALASADYVAPSHLPDGRPDYHLFLPVGWRDRPDAYADATDRITAAERAGLRQFVERLNLRWTAADGLPSRPDRLRFGPATDDRQVVEVLTRVGTGSLDAHDRRDAAQRGLRRAAELFIEELAAFPGGRDRWRLAYDQAGDLVGIVLPTRNPSSATIGYLGVVGEHRGHHYSDDLVIEALHLFAEAGETVVNDATDVGNAPMAASFDRVGYRVVGQRLIFT